MLWIVLALASNFCWAFGNIGDKHVVANRVKNPYVYICWQAFLALVLCLAIPFVDFYIPNTIILLWALLGAGCFVGSMLFYVKALEMEDITRINIWWGTVPIFSLMLAWFVLEETLTGGQGIAFVILLISSFLASIHTRRKGVSFSKAFWLMLGASFFAASYIVVLRYITVAISTPTAFMLHNVFTALWISLIFFSSSFRQQFKKETRNLTWGLTTTVIGITAINYLGRLFNIWALSLGPAALISAIGGAQALFVFLLATSISVFYPKVLGEKLDRKNILLKMFALICMIVGIYMINIP